MTKECAFYLDEGLPHQVADALKLVEFPIESAHSLDMLGWQDGDLIPELVRLKFTWITRDKKARREHLSQSELRDKLPVIWVHGFDRDDEPMSLRRFHHLMTNTLARAEPQISEARSALWFEMDFNGQRPTLYPLNMQGLIRRNQKRRKRAARR